MDINLSKNNFEIEFEDIWNKFSNRMKDDEIYVYIYRYIHMIYIYFLYIFLHIVDISTYIYMLTYFWDERTIGF